MEVIEVQEASLSLFQGPFLLLSILNLAFAAFFAILFLQSGLDKVSDRAGNLEWLTGHFAKSPLAGMVPLLLSIITVLEILAGLGALAGGIYFLISGESFILFWAEVLAMLNLLFLFFGQRMAKDYAGAAGIVPYFITVVIALLLNWGEQLIQAFQQLSMTY